MFPQKENKYNIYCGMKLEDPFCVVTFAITWGVGMGPNYIIIHGHTFTFWSLSVERICKLLISP